MPHDPTGEPPPAAAVPGEAPILDRAAHLRGQPEALAAMAADPASLCVPLWRGRCLVRGGELAEPVLLARASVASLWETAGEPVFLGLYGERACFALELPPDESARAHPVLARDGEFRDLRLAGNVLARADAELLAYARALLHWHRHNRFCARCGQPTRAARGGHQRVCDGCGAEHFPRTDPAVMALVLHEGRCLLARQPSFPPGMYSVLAGFAEPGETLEDAVAREVREEVGLTVREVRYLRSQPWPYPCSLMLGFVMRTRDATLRVDHEELEDARWLTADEIRAADGFFIPPRYSLARQLVDSFLTGEAPP